MKTTTPLERAHNRIECIRSFYTHLFAYAGLNIVLLIMWGLDFNIADIFWERTFFITAGLGGFAVLTHAIILFWHNYLLPKGWDERMIKKILSKTKKKI